ncbi:hypothetical protein Tco_0132558 [Tanacetum coccineum]
MTRSKARSLSCGAASFFLIFFDHFHLFAKVIMLNFEGLEARWISSAWILAAIAESRLNFPENEQSFEEDPEERDGKGFLNQRQQQLIMCGDIVKDSNSYLKSRGSIEDFVSFREMITSQLQGKLWLYDEVRFEFLSYLKEVVTLDNLLAVYTGAVTKDLMNSSIGVHLSYDAYTLIMCGDIVMDSISHLKSRKH